MPTEGKTIAQGNALGTDHLIVSARNPERVARNLQGGHRSQGVALRALPWAIESNAFSVH